MQNSSFFSLRKRLLFLGVFLVILSVILFSKRDDINHLFNKDYFIVPNEDIPIYEAVIQGWHQRNPEVVLPKEKRKFFVEIEVKLPVPLRSEEGKIQSALYAIKEFPSLENETIVNFFRSNRGVSIFNQNDLCSGTIPIVQPEALWDVWKNDFSRKKIKVGSLPGANGIVNFSRIAFNRSRTQALVSISLTRGELAAEGVFVILKKNNTSWEIEKEIVIWVS